jgi:hypothetical protein
MTLGSKNRPTETPNPKPTPPGLAFPKSRKGKRRMRIFTAAQTLRDEGILIGRPEKGKSIGESRRGLRIFLDKLQADLDAAKKKLTEAEVEFESALKAEEADPTKATDTAQAQERRDGAKRHLNVHFAQKSRANAVLSPVL